MESTLSASAPVMESAASASPAESSQARILAGTVPVLVFAAACITVGIIWDISWHVTIGRDSFWTPAHMAIYLGGTLGGLVAAWITWLATFRHRAEWEDSTVGILGIRSPLGAWVTMWGGAAMLTSAPLDDWWHNAYGLDVKILSPPHALLAAGMYGVVTGAALLVAAARNRSQVEGVGRWYVILALGIQLALASILLTEVSFPNLQHTSQFYLASAALYPTFLAAAARYSPIRWAATRMALVYTGLLLAMIWILPLFPAEPKLAPVFNRVTHMVPPAFPLLLLIPALAIDASYLFLNRWTFRGRGWLQLTVAALAFVALFLPVQWVFSAFLISPAADSYWFAGHGRFLGYMAQRNEWQAQFWRLERDPLTMVAVVKMGLIAWVAAGLGHAAGAFLSRLRR
ncbi:MAG: hypothetical protein J0M24_15185 [Verrucomicrobia bacterium]|nr:hypothetical protein [Verrucomicrobiota bacterium]